MSKAVPDAVTHLIEMFSRLPSIGNKTASRLTYFLLRAPDEMSLTLAQAINDLKANTRLCSICFNITDEDPCAICQDADRDRALIAVVEEPLDMLAIERTGSYRGRYHVLHGVISPRDGIGPDELKIDALVERVRREPVQELIICTNPGLQGDATAEMIRAMLEKSNLKHVKLTRLARGLPTGADLEYADSITVMRALQGRQAL
ncbi:MAG TPA: recombination mediator RecR [Aggregatilineales bacterium]|nr:recombination mediator RecR [Aggregatilineales bacterium]